MATNNQIAINISSAGDNTIIAGEAGVIIQVDRLVLSLATRTTVQFKSNSTSLSGPMEMISLLLDPVEGSPWYITGKGEALIISLGDAVQTGGTAWVTKA